MVDEVELGDLIMLTAVIREALMVDEVEFGKRAKSSVRYGAGEVGGEHCAICGHFVAGLHDGRCRLVAGVIGAMCWCRLWESRDE